MNTRQLLLKLSKRYPKRYAKFYHDYVGLMTGKLPEEVKKIVLCLDFDEQVLPLVEEDKLKEQLCKEIDALGIPVYSMHTNFDSGKDGMNDALTEVLGLEKVYGTPEKDFCMRIGELKEAMPVHEFAEFAKARLGVDYALLIDEGRPTIKKVGIVGGGGSRDWPIARDEGCDIYISGDISHHVRREIVCQHFNYLDVPHEVERIFMPQMKKVLLEIDPSLEVLMVDHEEEPTVIL